MAKRDNYWLRRPLSRRTFLHTSGAAGAGLAGAALVGCGNDDEGDDPSPTQSGNDNGNGNGGDASPTAGSGNGGGNGSGEARMGGTLRMIWNTPDAHWDPHSTTEHFSPEIYRAVSHGLLKQESVTSFPQADFARDWETADEDGLEFVFNLHENATWHDVAPVNGRAVTADDVVYSLERISTPGADAPRASTFEAVESYEAVDEHTVLVRLREPFVPILTPLSDKWTVIVAPEVVEQYGDLKGGESIVGFGPFIAEQAETSSGARIVRYEDYWGDPAYLDAVEYTTIRDEDARQAAFQSGQVDVSSVIPELFLDRFTSDDVEVYEWPDTSMAISLIGGPMDREPLNDERVRRAINLVIDRTDLGQAAFPGATQQNAGIFANPVWGLSAEEVAQLPGFQEHTTDEELAEAQQLMNDAGYGDGLSLVCNTTAAYEAHHINRAEALVPMLGRIGIDLELNVLEFAAMKDAEVTREFPFTAATYAAYGDPHTPLNNSFHSTGTRNYWNWNDPDYDAMVADQKAEFDDEARLEKIHEMQRYLLQGTPVSSGIWYMPIYMLAHKRVKNWQGTLSAGAPCSGWYLPSIWLEED